MSSELEGRVAIVTGGASGIGRAACRIFAREGARVVVADVNEDGGLAIVDQIGKEALFIKTDVSLSADAERLAAMTVERFGRIDLLYNNAAGTTLCIETDRPVHLLEEAVWDRQIAITLKSVFLCSKYILPHMMKQKRGVVINTSSTVALLSQPGSDSYTAAKGGVIALTRANATYYAQYGIRVNCIVPGYIITECQQWYHTDAKARALTDAMHLTRIGRAEDVAEFALYLASDRAEFITGGIFPVDGGFTTFKGASPLERDLP